MRIPIPLIPIPVLPSLHVRISTSKIARSFYSAIAAARWQLLRACLFGFGARNWAPRCVAYQNRRYPFSSLEPPSVCSVPLSARTERNCAPPKH